MATKMTWTFALAAMAVLMLTLGAGCDGKGTPQGDVDSPDDAQASPPADLPDEPDAADDGVRTILISKAQFSDIYPAVWFSPSTGEIVELVERSDDPPAAKFECWVEPSDPEFAFSGEDDGVGFAGFGSGDGNFEMDPPDGGVDLDDDLGDLLDDDPEILAGEPVFIVRGKQGSCMIQILKWDPDAQIIQFKWRSLDG